VQRPVPSQAEHRPQLVPTSGNAHCPAWHEPAQASLPPDAAWHAFRGSAPSATAVQIPTDPVVLQYSQFPAHAELQHTPSTQLPDTHSALPTHASPSAFCGWHALPSQYWSPGHPPHVPPETHRWHPPSHALSQHTPFAQKPLAQSAGAVQLLPLASLQVPAPSQALGATHGVVAVESVLRTGRFVQVPTLPLTSQAMQLAMQAVSQQAPSTQLPETQSSGPPGHPWPFSFLQAPLPSQALGEAQAGEGSWPNCGTFVQVPTVPARLHAMQTSAHAVLQHTVSTQWPEAQSPVPPGHPWPLAALQWPAPSHAFGATQALAGQVSAAATGRFPHVPRCDARSHAMQVAVHSASQQ
jgi:hypothetical protein